MATAILPVDIICNNLSCSSIKLPSGAVSNASIQANAAIDASKLVHVIAKQYQQGTASAVVADTQFCHIVNGSTCTLAYVKATVDTVATGADRTVSVDLQKRTGSGSWASVLTSTITFNSASTAGTIVSGSIATSTLAQDDYLKWVVTVAGSAGNQAIGVLAEAFFQEAAQ